MDNNGKSGWNDGGGFSRNPRISLVHLKPSFSDVVKYAENHSVDTRTAAYMLAIDRVAYDTRMRGIYA